MKKEIRSKMLALRKNLTQQQVAFAQEKVFNNLLTLPQFTLAKSCFCYVDFKNEVPTQKIREYFSQKQLLVPVVEEDIMHAVKFENFARKNIY